MAKPAMRAGPAPRAADQTADEGFGVYVHVPFCTHRCDYCAFATWTDRSHLMADYMACCRDQARALAAGMPPVTSVFFGGGTPNLVAPSMVAAVAAELPLASGAEMTVECNPDLVTSAGMRAYRDMGVNRISLGVQSMAPHVLAALGRQHDPSMVTASVDAVRSAGIGLLSLDLIFGSPAESAADCERTLAAAIALEPDHLSVYGLTPEPGTPLGDNPSRHPDDDDMADKYMIIDRTLERAGFEMYEISNWARPGARCRHNLLYWHQGAYAGIGCAAHSHRDGRRFWSVRTPERFIAAIRSGASVEAGSESLGPDERRLEALQLALRTSTGVPAGAVPDEVADLVMPAGDGRLRLNTRGRLLANEVAIRLHL
ncbi:radical SAM family heme chaperone HemW [Candidatus Poriferisodalis sp.]|uniref:radical SAM family heme chaperone HemW n=1 Tax=Candidatus Poriferisodalis sp. TaxID=3101277 RepID=UPI003B010670